MHKNAGLPYNTTLKDSSSDARALKQNYNQLRNAILTHFPDAERACAYVQGKID